MRSLIVVAAVLTCSTWQGVRTCSSPDGYVSHESTWSGITTGDDNQGDSLDHLDMAGQGDDHGRAAGALTPCMVAGAG